MNNTKLTHSSNYITSDIYQSIKTTHSICTKRKFSFALGAPMGGTAPLPPPCLHTCKQIIRIVSKTWYSEKLQYVQIYL